MATLDELFNEKLTENGDVAFKSTLNNLIDILFMCEYYSKHIENVKIGNSEKEQLLSLFIRDPRNGLGLRDLGRELMYQSECDITDVVFAGRYDDLFYRIEQLNDEQFAEIAGFLYNEILNGNELAKKWMPRYSSKNMMLARRFAKEYGMNKQQYGHFIKCNTTESKLSSKNIDDIKFEHVPSQAMLKYYKRFSKGEDTKERFAQYLKDVKNGVKDIKVSTTTVYDIYKNRETIDPDIFFEKIKKISGNWIPIVDTSFSMLDCDAMGKALSIGHYLAKCSTYAKDKVITFSSHPELITLGVKSDNRWDEEDNPIQDIGNSQYLKEIDSLYTGDCSNTDLGAVMRLLQDLTDMPEYLIILSDMEFDDHSYEDKEYLLNLWKERGYTTKIVWWNFNGRNRTCPEIDKNGNIFIGGYNPMLLDYLEAGFDGEKFLDTLLCKYAEKLKRRD